MRVYADFNGLQRSPRSGRQIVPLDTYGSLCDLAYAKTILSAGTKLTIHDQSDDSEDLEADATACYDGDLKCWVAEIDDNGIRDVPTQGVSCRDLVCAACRTVLNTFVAEYALNAESRCSSCDSLVWSPILPPARAP